VTPSPAAASIQGLPRAAAPAPPLPWAALALGLLLLGALAAPLAPELARDWMQNEDYSHGVLIPLLVAYLLWQRPGDWRPARVQASWLGPVLTLAGVALRLLGEVAVEQFTQRVSVLVVAAGLVASLWGRPGLRAWAYPLLYASLMIPLPGVLYNTVSFPLRQLATAVSADVLALAGIPVFRDGNVIHLARASLEVVDACSGIRSLLSLLAVSGALAYATLERWPRRLLLLLATLPVAFLANILRLVTTGVLAERYGQQVADGFLHTISGMGVFLVGTLAILALGRLLCARA
jgi:exosortase